MRVPSGGRVGSKGRSPKEKWENVCSYLVENPCFNIILLSLMQRAFKSVVCVQISLWGWKEGAKIFWGGQGGGAHRYSTFGQNVSLKTYSSLFFTLDVPWSVIFCLDFLLMSPDLSCWRKTNSSHFHFFAGTSDVLVPNKIGRRGDLFGPAVISFYQ